MTQQCDKSSVSAQKSLLSQVLMTNNFFWLGKKSVIGRKLAEKSLQ